MAQFTITIPDEFMEEALAAATRINQRQPAKQRQPEPLLFGETEVRSVTLDWLTNLIMADLTQEAEAEAEREAREKQQKLGALRSEE